MLSTLPYVALGGALGASLRFLAGEAVMRLMGPGFPWGTLFVNVMGSFAMGFAVVLFAQGADTRWAPFLTVGLLGGFTTFSAFSLDAVALFERGAVGLAGLYVLGSVVASIFGLFAGLMVARGVLS